MYVDCGGWTEGVEVGPRRVTTRNTPGSGGLWGSGYSKVGKELEH